MTIKQIITNKKSAVKLALSFSTLLALSACSGGDDTAADTAPVDQIETTVVEVAEPEVVEPIEETAVVEAPAVSTDEVAIIEADADNIAAESELLAVNAGEELYNKQCVACHQNGLLGAPKYGDAAAWAPRIAKGKEILYMHSAQGFNKMNAQASADVSVAQVHAAVDYMVAAAS